MEDNLKARVVQLNIITKVAKKYFTELEKYIQGTNPAEYLRLKTSVDTTIKYIEDLEKGFGKQLHTINDVDIENVHNIYQKIAFIESAISDFTIMCENKTYAKMLAQELSTGKHADLQVEFGRMKTAYEKYTLINNEPLKAALSTISINNVTKYYIFIRTNYDVNNFTMELSRKLISVLDGSRKIDVIAIIQRQKEYLLNAARVQTVNGVGHESIIYRNSLVPATILLPADELFKALSWEWNNELDLYENLTYLGASRNILLINRSTSTVVEFDFRGVINLEYVTDMGLRIPEFSGLTKKYISRYNTIKMSTSDVKPEKPRLYSTKTQYGAMSSIVLDWYIIENIGGNYRLLVNADHDGAISSTPGDNIKDLLIGVSSLNTEYNNILAGTSIRKNRMDMFDPRAKSLISQYVAGAKIIASGEHIRDKIIDMMRGTIDIIATRITNSGEFSQLFSSVQFTEAVNKATAHVISEQNHLLKRIESPEYLITHIAKIDGIIDKFTKAINRIALDEKMPQRLFSEYSREQLAVTISSAVISVLKKAADILEKDHIWVNSDSSLKEFILTN